MIEARVVELDPGAPVFEVPIKASYMPNVFVGLSVVEPALDSTAAPDLPPEARLPQYKAGYVKLALDTSSRRLQVAVETDRASYAPADTARVSLRVTGASGGGARARVSVAVVDEAVLALLQSPNPDPHGFFYATRGLGVMNDDTRLRLGLGAEHEAGALKESAGRRGRRGPGLPLGLRHHRLLERGGDDRRRRAGHGPGAASRESHPLPGGGHRGLGG